MNVLAFFTNNGVPATGLSATIRIRDVSDGSLVVTDDAMTEIGDGYYKYDFTGYQSSKDYAIRCDGSASLNFGERYTYAGNENYVDDIDWTIDNNTTILSISGDIQEVNTDILTVNTNILGVSADVVIIDSKIDSVQLDLDKIDTRIISLSASNSIASAGIIDGVWNSEIANYNTIGTFGGELATKADIASESSTIEQNCTSGGVIYGNVNTGTFVSTQLRDNVYWHIEEDVADGITVEFIFNINPEHRTGVVKTYGRYEGTPEGTHYMELWAYNFESLAWEQLQEVYLPGGNTSDAEYIHEYYSRHCSDTGEVRIRLIHNVTTYNANHDLYIDYIAVSSIDVLTAADIANAVWSENPSGYTTDGTFGNMLARAVGLVHENIYIDNPVYDGDGNLTSARLRIYSNPSDVGTANNVIGTYQITSPGDGAGRFTSWKQVRTS